MPHSAAMSLRDRHVEAMSRTPRPVGMVTTYGAGGGFGQTASGFCDIADEPPALIVCIEDHGLAADAFRLGGAFRLNVLSSGDDHVADAFALGARIDELAPGGWDAEAVAGPESVRAVASFACRLREVRIEANRLVIVGDVTDAASREDAEPLLRLNHGYRRVEDLPLPMFPGFPLADHERTTNRR